MIEDIEGFKNELNIQIDKDYFEHEDAIEIPVLYINDKGEERYHPWGDDNGH